MFKPIVSANYRPRPSTSFDQRPPNNIFNKLPEKNNHNGFQIYDINFEDFLDMNPRPSFVQRQPPATPVNYYPTSTTKPLQRPATESSINLITHHNNFGFEFNPQNPKPITTTTTTTTTSAPPVIAGPTSRTQDK